MLLLLFSNLLQTLTFLNRLCCNLFLLSQPKGKKRRYWRVSCISYLFHFQLVVDIVSGRSSSWVKIVARNPRALSVNSLGGAQFGQKNIVDQVEQSGSLNRLTLLSIRSKSLCSVPSRIRSFSLLLLSPSSLPVGSPEVSGELPVSPYPGSGTGW